MANINKIALPDGTQYDIEDAVVRGAISNINSFNIQIVQSLPTTNIDSHTIYLLSKSAIVGSSTVGDSTVGGENDTYDEYIYVNNAWEKLGDDINTDVFARVEDIPTKVSDLTDDVGMITEWTQSDWEASSSDSAAYILNKPAIRADYGENSIVENDVNADSPTEYTMNFTGEAGATTYTWPQTGTIPSAPKLVLYNNNYYLINEWKVSSSTCTLNKTLSADTALSSTPVKVYNSYPTAIGNYSHVEGKNNIAYGNYSHVEGYMTISGGISAHAEGGRTKALGNSAHAEGSSTEASGGGSHAEGSTTKANGTHSHSEGSNTIANHKSQHVFGEYNIEDPSTTAVTARGNYVEIVGNGTAINSRSNARTLDWSGNETLAGKLTVGAGPTNNMDVATKQYVDSAIPEDKVFLINITFDDGEYLSDKTKSQITAAISAGKLVYLKETIVATSEYYYLSTSSRFCDEYAAYVFVNQSETAGFAINSGIIKFPIIFSFGYFGNETNNTVEDISSITFIDLYNCLYYYGKAYIWDIFSNAKVLITATALDWENKISVTLSYVDHIGRIHELSGTSSDSGGYDTLTFTHYLVQPTLSISNNVITLSGRSIQTSSITLPVYSGSVSTVGGGS